VIDASEPEIMEDLILAAMTDAKRKADEASQKVLGEVTSGMGLPGGMGIPGFGG
jgi:nucleoid-associated protein EbfC